MSTHEVEKFWDAQERLVLQSSDHSLGTIASMVAASAIDLSPVFQRRERWGHAQQSALIESFLLNIPVPPVYLAEDLLGQYQVIDGKQRLTAIAGFLSGEFSLRELREFHEFDGLRFSELPDPVQRALEFRPLRSVTLLRQSDPDLKHEVFRRLNTGGEPLNDQEIRNVVYRGDLNNMIYHLSENAFLRDRLKITSDKSPSYQQMQDAEYVLRFLTISESWYEFSGSLRDSMDEFMENNTPATRDRIAELRERFSTAIEDCEAVWGDHAFRRPDGDGWRIQTLAGMYDAQMVALYELGPGIGKRLARKKQAVQRGTRRLFADPQFDSAVRQATNTPSRIAYRISKMIEMLTSLS